MSTTQLCTICSKKIGRKGCVAYQNRSALHKVNGISKEVHSTCNAPYESGNWELLFKKKPAMLGSAMLQPAPEAG